MSFKSQHAKGTHKTDDFSKLGLMLTLSQFERATFSSSIIPLLFLGGGGRKFLWQEDHLYRLRGSASPCWGQNIYVKYLEFFIFSLVSRIMNISIELYMLIMTRVLVVTMHAFTFTIVSKSHCPPTSPLPFHDLLSKSQSPLVCFFVSSSVLFLW